MQFAPLRPPAAFAWPRAECWQKEDQFPALIAAAADTADPEASSRYRRASLTILDSLCDDRYLAWNTPGWEGVVKHGVYHFHKKLGVDESVMWGDFFFLQAVWRVLKGL